MDRIKSALEKAMERAEQLEAPTEEERLEWKWVPEGNRLAAQFLEAKVDLVKEVAKVEGPARRYVLKGTIDVLVENVRLPKNEHVVKTNEHVLEALPQLKTGRTDEIVERIRYVCTQYFQFFPQQQQEAYGRLKEQLQSQLEQTLRQQTGAQGPVQLGNIEARPEFQAQWLRVLGQMEEPYEQHLREYRRQIQELL